MVLALVLLLGSGAGVPALASPSRSSVPRCSSDWLSFQHDQDHTGASCGAINALDVSTLVPSWFARTGGPVTAEPTVVGHTAYVGDGNGVFYALSTTTGKPRWTFNITATDPHTGQPYDSHAASNGEIVSSAAYTNQLRGLPPMVVFGGGGSVFALNAATGAVVWHTDLAPSAPTGPDEVETSPSILPRVLGSGVVIVGLDTNESARGISGGVLALNARTGKPIWNFEPLSGKAGSGLTRGPGAGCSDVWSSPVVDPAAPKGGLVVFGTGNCPDGHASIEAVSLQTGQLRWEFVEPAANHGTDDDFGSSPVLTHLGRLPVVLEGGKSGWMYVLREYSGQPVNSAQVAQPGQTGDAVAAAIGGFIGSVALSSVGGHQVVIGNTAIPAPFAGDGVTPSGTKLDTSLLGDPTRISSLHAYDITTGRVLWQEPLQLPSYAPVTTVGGVAFAPSTTGFSIAAYSTSSGLPLWAFPLAASPSSGVAVTGSSIVFGAGTDVGPGLPPQLTGVWMFHLAGG